MKAFGLELRKVGSVESLYKEVDSVLSKSGLAQGINSQVQSQTVAHALQKMFEPNSWFSICTIDACVNICKVCIPKERYDIYRAIHCVHWNEMLPEYRQTIVAMVLDDFRICFVQ